MSWVERARTIFWCDPPTIKERIHGEMLGIPGMQSAGMLDVRTTERQTLLGNGRYPVQPSRYRTHEEQTRRSQRESLRTRRMHLLQESEKQLKRPRPFHVINKTDAAPPRVKRPLPFPSSVPGIPPGSMDNHLIFMKSSLLCPLIFRPILS